MTTDVRRRERCRLCESPLLELALPIEPSPIADAYIPATRLGQPQETYPLDLYLCLECGHVQNLDIVNPETLFRDYLFTTSSSGNLVDHFRQYAGDVVSQFEIKQGSLVVEIGSNDGSLLQFFKGKGLNVLGVDPARSIAAEANAKGIPTLPEFFSEELAVTIRREYGSATVITANNVFAHADDLAAMVRGIDTLLADDGIFVFEASYLVDIVDRFLFDTVYHEHVSYHSIAPLKRFFDKFGLQLFDVQRNASKGGSIRGFVQHPRKGGRPIAPIVGELLEMENRRGFATPEVYRTYGEAITERKNALARLIDGAHACGKRVAGYGASNTVTTLMWHFGLIKKIEFLVDDNPRKQGLFSPRCHLPVLPPEELYTRRPDYVLVLAWNYAEPIIKRHRRFMDQGGKFVIPLPEVRIV